MKRLALAFCVSLLLASATCMPSKYKEFIELPTERQIEMMRGMSTEEQIDYYLAGQSYAHPPLMLQEPIAERGREAVPAIMKRIREAEDDMQVRDLLSLLTWMDSFHYDLKNEAGTLAELEGVIAKMKDPIAKDTARRDLKEVAENEPPKAQKVVPGRAP